MQILYEGTTDIPATVSEVSRWITDPEKILLYAPSPIEGKRLEGEKLWIRLKTGVSLIEKTNVEEKGDKVVITVKVTASTFTNTPTSEEEITDHSLMSFFEDWHLEPSTILENGTRIVKVWRDIEKHKLRWLPLGWLVIQSAKKDIDKMKEVWK
mmetsp:Transcript_14801/g.27844  ORF Transcript_14801/g.27844 Transcript_14801/m.27844 type:complete len:154 (+) Transcript_14801:104-565(+)